MMIVFALFSYLIGSIPFGLIFTKLFNSGDIKKIGSGNIGATNVLRTGDKKAAILTLICDVLKGWITVYAYIRFAGINSDYLYTLNLNIAIISLLAVLGHIFPIWIGFKGGKGVATIFGIYLAISPLLSICLLVIWITVFFISKLSSLAAISSISFAAPVIGLISSRIYEDFSLLLFSLILSLIIIITHKSNIIRLIKKEELKFSK